MKGALPVAPGPVLGRPLKGNEIGNDKDQGATCKTKAARLRLSAARQRPSERWHGATGSVRTVCSFAHGVQTWVCRAAVSAGSDQSLGECLGGGQGLEASRRGSGCASSNSDCCAQRRRITAASAARWGDSAASLARARRQAQPPLGSSAGAVACQGASAGGCRADC